jgi:putative redox protein
MTSKVIYTGELRTISKHVRSGMEIITDAPVDNHGKGEAFSPTDLLATSLGACVLTVMGIVAGRHEINLDGTSVEITKHMADSPRRVAGIDARIVFSAKLNLKSDKDKALLENTAWNCPVAKSLHPDLKLNIEFVYPSVK